MDYNEERESLSGSPTFSTYSESPSYDSEGYRKRGRPLAMAVNFKYNCVAEDGCGRPIVITPTGSKTSPIDLTSHRNLQKASVRVLSSSWSVAPDLGGVSLDSMDSEYSRTNRPDQSFSSL